MKILYIANCGFGDVSWTTSWPRIWSEKGHEVDVFLMEYTGNPFHANSFIKNIFVVDRLKSAKEISTIVEGHSYDYILIPTNSCSGVQEVIEVIKDFKNVYPFKGHSQRQIIIKDLEIPPLSKPEWNFTESEFKYIEDLKFENSVLFHPLSSSIHEKSRNIDFDLIIECSKSIKGMVVVFGGKTKYIPMKALERMETAGIRLLWEGYNCFNDKFGSTLGKFLALTTQCRVSVHAWSGSFTFPMGYNKPYVMVVPGCGIRANNASPYIDSNELYIKGIQRAETYGCLNHSVWCITDQAEIITEAVNYAVSGKTGTYDKIWAWS